MEDSDKNPNYWLLLGRKRGLAILGSQDVHCGGHCPQEKRVPSKWPVPPLLSPPQQADLFFTGVLTYLPTSPRQPWLHKHYCREINQKKKRERAGWGRKTAAEARATGF